MTLDEIRAAYRQAKAAGDQRAMDALAAQFRAAEANDGKGAGLMRAGLSGASFGFWDEMEGLARSLWNDTKYTDERDKVRGEMKMFADENPAASLSAEVAGGMLVPGLGAVKTLHTIGQAGQTVKGMVGAGAAMGGLAGLGATEDIGDSAQVAQDVASGAAVGGVMGGILPAAERGYRYLKAPTAEKQQAKIYRALTQDNMGNELTPEAAAAQVAPGGTMAEVNPTTRGVAFGSQMGGGQRQQEYANFLMERQNRMGQDVEDILRQESGVNVDRAQALEALRQQRDIQAEDLYGPLRGQQTDISPEMIEMVRSTPQGQEAARTALQGLQIRRRQPNLTMEEVQDDFDFWHRVQQRLREQAEGLANPAREGSSRMMASEIRGLRDDLVQEMVERNSWGERYATATAAYREASNIMDALEDSEKLVRMPLDKLRAAVDGVPDNVRDAYVVGLITDLVGKTAKSPTDANKARNLIKSSDMRRRMDILMGPERAQRVIDRLGAKMEEGLTYGEVFLGSPTARRQAVQQSLAAGELPPELLDAALQADPTGMMRSVARRMAGGGKELSPEVADEVRGLMMQTDPLQITEALRALRQPARELVFSPLAIGGGMGVYGSE